MTERPDQPKPPPLPPTISPAPPGGADKFPRPPEPSGGDGRADEVPRRREGVVSDPDMALPAAPY
jgi:hypothetical protein